MIKVKQLTKPTKLDSTSNASNIKSINGAIRKILKKGNAINGEKDLLPLWRTVRSIKEELFNLNHGKCAYCESQDRDKRTMDVEHFRPKLAIYGVTNHPGYWWLAYDAHNYLLSCKVCNTDHKATHFPLIDESKRATSESDDHSIEQPVLINPNEEDPSKCIGFKNRPGPINCVIAVGLDGKDRGHRTIKICGLNDGDLCEARGDCLTALRIMVLNMHHAIMGNKTILIDRTAKGIKEYTSSRKPFAGFRRDYFREADLGAYIADD